jgi:type IV secretory pathway VirB10-like protein
VSATQQRFSPVARGRSGTPLWVKVAAVALVVLLMLAFGYWFFLAPNAPVEIASDQPRQSFDLGAQLREPTAPPASVAHSEPPKTQTDPKPKPDMPPPSGQNSDPGVAPVSSYVNPKAEQLLWAVEQKPGSPGTDGKPSSDGADGKQDSAYAQSMQTTRVADTKPKFRRFPPSFTLRKGELISCTPPMPIDTQLPGPLYCLVDYDVPSMDNNNKRLLPAGTQINLQIERGLGLGQDRAVIVATDALTPGPDFLPIPLDGALGAGPNGQNGVPVDVNEHTWQRLKQAAMLAGVENGSSILQSALSHGNNGNTYFGSVGNSTQSLASIAFQHDINIPVTGYRGPGYPITIYVNHYIDLSNFYRNELAGGR